eukprot:scpid92326/ scgid1368/ Protogenin B
MDGRHRASTSVDVKLGVGAGRRRPLTTGYLRSMMSDTIRIGLYLLIMAGVGYSSNSPPTFLVKPQSSYTYPAAGTAALTIPCTASGSPTPKISWWRNDQLITSGVFSPAGELLINITSSAALSVLPQAATLSNHAASTGWYYCMAASSQGSITADFSLAVLGKNQLSTYTCRKLLESKDWK